MINTGREWDWMDDEEDKIEQIKDEEWDYYSGLPNPKWYESE